MILTFFFQDEKYHTELVLYYVDEAVRLMNDKSTSPEELEEARSKLQDLLTSSSHYQPQPVLARMKGTELHVEIAAVYGRVSCYEFSFNFYCLRELLISLGFVYIMILYPIKS